MPMKGNITVAWLDNGEVTSDFAVSICDTFRVHSDRITGRVIVRSGGAITRGRNASIDQFLTQSNDEWVLLVDSDMSWTTDALSVLIEHAHSKKVPVIGGLCFAQSGMRAGSFQTLIPTIYNKVEKGYMPLWEYPDNALVECDGTGAAFLLVHRDVLLKIQADTGLGRWSWFHEGPTEDLSNWLSEDLTFCNLIKASGFPIYVHTGAKIGHVKGIDYVLDEAMYRMFQGKSANADA